MPRYRIEMSSYRVAGWACLVLFAVIAMAAYNSGARVPGICFLSFALLGLYMVLRAGSFQIDEERVVHQSAFGAWQLRWDEITHVEIGSGGTLVLSGEEKRFVLSPPPWWRRTDREALRYVLAQFETRKLEVRLSRTADYKIMKNTRISRR